MRLRANVQFGQTWSSNDPRRLSAFRVIDVTDGVVVVESIYPKGRPLRALRLESFLLTGAKGYSRLK